jgi:acyl carrier protein
VTALFGDHRREIVDFFNIQLPLEVGHQFRVPRNPSGFLALSILVLSLGTAANGANSSTLAILQAKAPACSRSKALNESAITPRTVLPAVSLRRQQFEPGPNIGHFIFLPLEKANLTDALSEKANPIVLVALGSFVLLLLLFAVSAAGRFLTWTNRQAEAASAVENVNEAAGDPLEDTLVAMWEEVLDAKLTGIQENFFDAGGDSLSAMRLLARLSSELKVDISFSELFDEPTVRGLAGLVRKQLRGRSALSLAGRDDPRCYLPSAIERSEPMHPLSFSQAALWGYQRMLPNAWTFNMPLVLRLRGELDLAALRYAFKEIMQRHEVLRSVMDEKDGIPYQRISDSHSITIEVEDKQDVDQENIQQAIKSEERAKFDLTTGPLLRVRVLKAGIHEHLLLLTIHHIAFDGWSYGLMFEDLSSCYNGYRAGHPESLGTTATRYVDFARWQRRFVESAKVRRQLEYWKRQLALLSPAEIPADVQVDAKEPRTGRYMPMVFDQLTTAALRTLCSELKVSLFTMLASVLAMVIRARTGAEDVALGTIVANRRLSDFEGVSGFFVNAVVLRSDLHGDPSFVDFLKKNRRVVSDALDNQDLPFGQLIEGMGTPPKSKDNPFYQGIFVLQSTPMSALKLEGLEIERYSVGYDIARADFVVEVEDHRDTLSGGVYYDSDRFTSQTMGRLASCFQMLMARVVAAPATRLRKMVKDCEGQVEIAGVENRDPGNRTRHSS